jgi:hypothetical protein
MDRAGGRVTEKAARRVAAAEAALHGGERPEGGVRDKALVRHGEGCRLFAAAEQMRSKQVAAA